MKYYIVYVKENIPTLKTFKTKKALAGFMKKFKVDQDANWIDYVFYGNRLK